MALRRGVSSVFIRSLVCRIGVYRPAHASAGNVDVAVNESSGRCYDIATIWFLCLHPAGVIWWAQWPWWNIAIVSSDV